MADAAVVNASPLIHLTRAGQLDLLRLAGEEVFVPEEVESWGSEDPAALALRRTEWLRTVPNVAIPASVQSWDLGAGETAVLSHALAAGATAVLDDRAGRRCALAHRIPLRGTLGLVLVAKKRGKIPAARPLLEDLRAAGMYLSDAVLNRALELVGE